MSEIKALLVMLAEYYQKTLTDNQVRMYAEDLSEFPFEEVSRAMDSYRKNPNNKFFPIPAQLVEIMRPGVDDQSEAVEVSGRIWEAIGKFGRDAPARAKSFVGEVGWHVVQRMGGWAAVCEVIAEDGGIFRAQMREIAKSAMIRSKLGILDQPPMLPKNDEGPKLLGEFLSIEKLRGP